MKRTKKEQDLAGFRRATARISEIYREMRNVPPVKLDKKIFAGHWRFLKVRSDVLRSSIGTQIASVVDACNTWCLGKKKDPASYRTGTEMLFPNKGSYRHGISSWVRGQGLRPLPEDEYEKAGFPDFFRTKWFRVQENVIRAGTKNIVKEKFFPQIPPHMLEFDYKPGYIEQVHEPSGYLESELVRLLHFMDVNDGWRKIGDSRNRDEWDLSLPKKKMEKSLAIAEIREFKTKLQEE